MKHPSSHGAFAQSDLSCICLVLFEAEQWLAAFTNPYRNALNVLPSVLILPERDLERTSVSYQRHWDQERSARARTKLHASNADLPDKWKDRFAFSSLLHPITSLQPVIHAGWACRGLQWRRPKGSLFDEGANYQR